MDNTPAGKLEMVRQCHRARHEVHLRKCRHDSKEPSPIPEHSCGRDEGNNAGDDCTRNVGDASRHAVDGVCHASFLGGELGGD